VVRKGKKKKKKKEKGRKEREEKKIRGTLNFSINFPRIVEKKKKKSEK